MWKTSIFYLHSIRNLARTSHTQSFWVAQKSGEEGIVTPILRRRKLSSGRTADLQGMIMRGRAIQTSRHPPCEFSLSTNKPFPTHTDCKEDAGNSRAVPRSGGSLSAPRWPWPPHLVSGWYSPFRLSRDWKRQVSGCQGNGVPGAGGLLNGSSFQTGEAVVAGKTPPLWGTVSDAESVGGALLRPSVLRGLATSSWSFRGEGEGPRRLRAGLRRCATSQWASGAQSCRAAGDPAVRERQGQWEGGAESCPVAGPRYWLWGRGAGPVEAGLPAGDLSPGRARLGSARSCAEPAVWSACLKTGSPKFPVPGGRRFWPSVLLPRTSTVLCLLAPRI